MSKQKHEMLFSRFGINYNKLPERYRKGSVLVREEVSLGHARAIPNCELKRVLLLMQVNPPDGAEVPQAASSTSGEDAAQAPAAKAKKAKVKTEVRLYHCDVIEDTFWDARPYLLE